MDKHFQILSDEGDEQAAQATITISNQPAISNTDRSHKTKPPPSLLTSPQKTHLLKIFMMLPDFKITFFT